MSTGDQNPAPTSTTTDNPPAGSSTNQDDYLDKGVAAAEKKYGVDPQKNRAITEKITDGARSLFEKATGKKVPAKFSN